MHPLDLSCKQLCNLQFIVVETKTLRYAELFLVALQMFLITGAILLKGLKIGNTNYVYIYEGFPSMKDSLIASPQNDVDFPPNSPR